MFGFTLKKYFYDLWDNIMTVLLTNVLLMSGLMVSFLLPPLFMLPPSENAILVSFGFLVTTLCVGIVSRWGADIVESKKAALRDFFPYLAKTWGDSLFTLLWIFFMVMAVITNLNFYLAFDHWLASAALGVVLTLIALWVLASQFYLAFRHQRPNNFGRTLVTMFQFLFQNPGFVLLSFLTIVVLLILSVVTLGLMPGLSGVLLFWNTALRQRLKKYTWLEENPDQKGKQIPWFKLQEADKKKLAERNIRNIFQSWS